MITIYSAVTQLIILLSDLTVCVNSNLHTTVFNEISYQRSPQLPEQQPGYMQVTQGREADMLIVSYYH